MFAYLKKYNRSTVCLDDTQPEFDESRFQICDWKEYYPGAAEAKIPGAPKLRGKKVTMFLLC